MKALSNKQFMLLMLLISTISILPFIWSTDYHTKGEPRESIVSYTMIAQDNWISPVNNGGEIAYKPPFFHWSIAALSSLLNNGTVTEGLSRLPSALAMIAMTMAVFLFFYKRKGKTIAIYTGIITLTNFELHRGAMNCRVDMVLTAFTVIALLEFYRWYEHKMKGLPWLAIICMSLGTLTKGPVGMVVPCLVMGCFLLLRKVYFWKAFFMMVGIGLLSLIIPSIWYFLAYQQRGEEFLALMMEENVGRMTNTMAYDSCVNPWPYNFLTLFAGFIPWVLLLLLSLFTIHLHKMTLKPSTWWHRFKEWASHKDAVNLFSLTAIVIIFVFYCIPQSKRSVYLMPIYPFIAYYIAYYLVYMCNKGCKAIRIYGGILSVIGILLFVVFIIVKGGLLQPESLFHGRHAADNIRYFVAISEIKGILSILLILLPSALSVYWWKFCRNTSSQKNLAYIFLLTFALYFSLDGVYQPAVLNAKSDKRMAHEIEAAIPSQAPIYSFIYDTINSKGDPIHFYITDFYLNDRIDNFYLKHPKEGYMILKEEDLDHWYEIYGNEGYTLEPVYKGYKKCRDVGGIPVVYRFSKK